MFSGKLYLQDGKISGVTCSSRLLGCGYLFPIIVPDPYVTQHVLGVSDTFIIVANSALWQVVSPQQAVKAVGKTIDPVVSAKRLQDLAQGCGARENLAVLVVRIMMSSSEQDRVQSALSAQRQQQREILRVLSHQAHCVEDTKHILSSSDGPIKEKYPLEIKKELYNDKRFKCRIRPAHNKLSDLHQGSHESENYIAEPSASNHDANNAENTDIRLQKRLLKWFGNETLEEIIAAGDNNDDIENTVRDNTIDFSKENPPYKKFSEIKPFCSNNSSFLSPYHSNDDHTMTSGIICPEQSVVEDKEDLNFPQRNKKQTVLNEAKKQVTVEFREQSYSTDNWRFDCGISNCITVCSSEPTFSQPSVATKPSVLQTTASVCNTTDNNFGTFLHFDTSMKFADSMSSLDNFKKQTVYSSNVDRDAMLFHKMQMARAQRNMSSSSFSIQSDSLIESVRQVSSVNNHLSSRSIEVLVHSKADHNYEDTHDAYHNEIGCNGSTIKDMDFSSSSTFVGDETPRRYSVDNHSIEDIQNQLSCVNVSNVEPAIGME